MKFIKTTNREDFIDEVKILLDNKDNTVWLFEGNYMEYPELNFTFWGEGWYSISSGEFLGNHHTDDKISYDMTCVTLED